MPSVSAADEAAISAQLGRQARGVAAVVARCCLGLPVVTVTTPVLPDGTPFPTLYWLTCPLARRRIGRVESGGGVKAADAEIAASPTLQKAMAGAHAAYARARASLLPLGVKGPAGGIAGAANPAGMAGVKCLHAHAAHHLAGGENPIGARTVAAIAPLCCPVPCVLGGVPNPAWREP